MIKTNGINSTSGVPNHKSDSTLKHCWSKCSPHTIILESYSLHQTTVRSEMKNPHVPMWAQLFVKLLHPLQRLSQQPLRDARLDRGNHLAVLLGTAQRRILSIVLLPHSL